MRIMKSIEFEALDGGEDVLDFAQRHQAEFGDLAVRVTRAGSGAAVRSFGIALAAAIAMLRFKLGALPILVVAGLVASLL